MGLRILNLVQGTGEWLSHRAACLNASDAPAMRGASKYQSRSDLIRQKATGIQPEHDAGTLARFRAGHDAEASIRPYAESIIGEPLYPVTGENIIDGLRLSASSDGLNMDGNIGFEHKLWNEALAESVNNGVVPDSHIWQIVHQHVVFGIEKTLFVVSDGTDQKAVHCWVTTTPEQESALLAGWKQFQADVAEYQPEESAAPVIGAEPETLPALFVQVEGRVVAGDVKAYRAHVDSWVAQLPAIFETDQDFKDGAKAVKACEDAESNLKALAQQIRGQMHDVDTVFRLLEESGATIRDARLRIDAAVKLNSKRIREQAVINAGNEFRAYIETLSVRIGVPLPFNPVDFGASIKGLKTVASMNNAIGTALANYRIKADAVAFCIAENKAAAAGCMHLFPDFMNLCTKEPADFKNLIIARQAEAERRETARLESERARIRAEEQAKAEREAQAKAQAEQAERDAESARLRVIEEDRVAKAQAQAIADALASSRAEADANAQPLVNLLESVGAKVVDVTPVDDGATIKLGDICARLGFTLTAQFVASLGFDPVSTDRSAKLYRASDFHRICAALVRHIQTVQAGQPAPVTQAAPATTRNPERTADMATRAPAAAFDDAANYQHIPMKEVESHKIKAVGYDEATRTLAVTFQRGAGAIYHYPDVEPQVYADFIGAESLGTFFGQHLQSLPFKKFRPEEVVTWSKP